MLQALRAHGFKRLRWWHRGTNTERFNPGPRDQVQRYRLTGGIAVLRSK
jgi:hypothetical protein